jgi:hypothetical protein
MRTVASAADICIHMSERPARDANRALGTPRQRDTIAGRRVRTGQAATLPRAAKYWKRRKVDFRRADVDGRLPA